MRIARIGSQIVLILILGLGIGLSTPWIMHALPIKGEKAESQWVSTPSIDNTYSCRIDHGILSVVQGLPTEDGQRIVTGLDVSNWPPEMLSMAEKIQFHSLDEVQSFIDSISEELWLE